MSQAFLDSSTILYLQTYIFFSQFNKYMFALVFPPSVTYVLCGCVLSHFSCVWLFATTWTVARQAPLSMGFSRQEYWSGLSCPPQGIFLTQGLNACLPCLLYWQVVSLPLAPPRKPYYVLVVQLLSHVWLCDPMDCSPPGSSVHGILQARILEWVVLPSSRGTSPPRDQTCVSQASCIAGGFFTAEPLGKPQVVNYSGKIIEDRILENIC